MPKLTILLQITIASILLSILAHDAVAQCGNWIAGPLHRFVGTDSQSVSATATWDPDGAGPLTAQLAIAGDFTYAGGVELHGIGRWDGTTWQPIGGGLIFQMYTGKGNALGVFPAGSGALSGQLVVGGVFDHAGGTPANNIARWDGTQWQPFATGVDGTVLAIGFWDPDGPSGPLPTQLVVGGTFLTAGGVAVNGIARWDGAAWQPLGSGVGGTSIEVDALTTWDPDGTGPLAAQLIAGGYFTTAGGITTNGIARWDGAAWNAIGSGTVGVSGDPAGMNPYPAVVALTTWDPDGAGPQAPVLVAGGYFDTAGGNTVNGIARWNGTSWTSFSTGMNDEVEALTVFNGQLIAGGDFTTAGGTSARSAAVWTGSAWQAFGFGVDSDILSLTPWTPPGTTTPQLAAGGYFLTSGSAELIHLGTWTGIDWRGFAPPAISVNIYAMAQLGSNVIGAGDFTVSASSAISPNDIASWNGADVGAFGTGFSAPVHALKTYNTGIGLSQALHIVAGGQFTTAGGVAANCVAQWNQNAFAAFPVPAWSAMGNGFNNAVYAVERFNSTVYAAGGFTASGATTLSHIASWTGTAWQPVGNLTSQGLDGWVFALCVYNGSLYAGGSFTHAGSTLTGGLARWDGTAWSSVGGNFGGSVYALGVYNNQLVIGGAFSGINGSPNLAQYNGSIYSTFGTGGANAPIRAVAAGPDGRLYVGGDFTAAGGLASAPYIAAWNGSAWSAVAGGTNAPVYALYPYHNEIAVGGLFTAVQGSAVPSSGWARYSTDGVPWVQRSPSPVGSACVGTEVSFYARAAEGYIPTYTWRHNGVPITLGITPWGSRLSSDGATLDIANVRAQDAGSYDAIVADSCGSTITSAATLSVCVADFNCDHAVSVQDIFDYLNAWFTGDQRTNVNGVGGVTVQDIFDFLNAWFAGC